MRYLGRAGSEASHECYRRTVAEWLATGRPGRRSEGSDVTLTVGALTDAYLAWARTYYVAADGRPSPGLGPVEAAAKALVALYRSTPSATFGPVALRAVRQFMVEAGLCRNVINQRTACVRRIFRWGVSEELVSPSVVQALTAVDPLRAGRSGARETPAVEPVPDAHVEAVLPFLPPTLRAMVRLQRATGMRSDEVCRLRTVDVDRSGDVWVYRPPTHKTSYRGHVRAVYCGPQARTALEPMLRADDPRAFVFSPARAVYERRQARRCGRQDAEQQIKTDGRTPASESRDDARPVADPSARYDPRSYRRALNYAMDAAVRAGAMTRDQRWFPHQLRHRHATAVRQCKGLEAARVLLGHRTLSQTLGYAEADRATAMAVARELA